jgi:imidazole glycerol-phosphate synthase subunit HisH
MKISIVNYGVANVGSMLNMMRKLGIPAEAISTPDEVARAEKIILPGIGAFDHGMKALTNLGLTEPLRRRVLDDRMPLLGVCLGMQMLGNGSEEGTLRGLDLIGGQCRRFQANGIRVPHMGWNELAIRRPGGLLQGLDEARFYFVHSYHFVCDDAQDELAMSHYGIDFTAAVNRGRVWGVQFHPEKSHRFGMALLRNFVAL